MIQLPKGLERDFMDSVYRIEGEKQMPYINTAERLGLERGLEEGRMEGELSGELKGERGILCRQIELKFGHVPTDVRNQIDQASREQLERYSANILHASLAEDVVLED